MSLLVGLTGGIGSGKSLAATYFEKLGAHIIDADLLCRELVLPGRPALKEIVSIFGQGVLDSKGVFDRKKTAELVFKDKVLKKKLEAILHPKVFELEKNKYSKIIQKDPLAIVIIDAALLIESNNYKQMDKVLLIRCSEKIQIDRVLSRGNFTREEVALRIKNQMSFAEKAIFADIILDNDLQKGDLRKKINNLYPQLLRLSKIQINQ